MNNIKMQKSVKFVKNKNKYSKDKIYREVRDLSHYTGQYRGAG